MQSNRLTLVAPLSILLVASSVNYACTNNDDGTPAVDAGVYVDGGIQYGVPPGAGAVAPAGDDDTTGDDASTGGDASTGTDGSTGDSSTGTDGSTGTSTFTFAVLRLGDGTAALPAAQTTSAAFIDYYKTDGTSGGTSIALPATTFSVATSTSAGGMTRSTDGHYLVLGGFGAAAKTANSASLKRVAARINAAGTVDTTTVIGAFNTSATAEIRSVASVDGSSFWTVGTGTPDGTCWSPYGDTTGGSALQLENVPATTRDVGIFSGQLYITAATTTAPDFVGVGPVGTGTPKSYVTNGSATPLTGMGSGNTSPYGFVGFDTDTTAGIDLIYIADATTGVEKWQLGSGGSWAKVGTAVAIGTGTGARSITGTESAGAVTLLATSFDGSVIAKITDTVSSTTNGTGATLVSAATNEGFRGIALAPN